MKFASFAYRCLAFVSGMLLLNLGAVCCAHDFVAVFFDNDSAKALQVDAPVPRDLKAKVIGKVAEAGARGLVVKFFEDLPRNETNDQIYAKALCLMPTTLQACLCLDGATNGLPERFFITKTNQFRLRSVIADKQGYIPLPAFSACARGVGFVDLERPDDIPLLEMYQGHFVKSLYVTALELESGNMADYSSGSRVSFGKRSLSFNSAGEHPLPIRLKDFTYVPFHQVLNGTIPAEKFRGKIVILGYDGTRIHGIKTSRGEIKAHRLFVQSLMALAEELESAKL